uniref:WAP domain-containing protein n=1 Tax=Cyanistes caeruleus TaxID=156563 RepID=A0A8C0Z968_CYACU
GTPNSSASLTMAALVLRSAARSGRSGPKPGRCPRDFMRCLRLDSPLCANDSSCPAGLKCCHWECRLRCIPPAEGTAPRYSR